MEQESLGQFQSFARAHARRPLVVLAFVQWNGIDKEQVCMVLQR
jgi:hypothetical protein